jgi:hypothetical protein
MTAERRIGTLRRQINEIGMRGGEAQESKVWAQIGKGLCVWLIYKHADALIGQWETLFVLLLFIIAPELIKKFITMRFGGGGGYTERTERTESITKKEEPDNAVAR